MLANLRGKLVSLSLVITSTLGLGYAKSDQPFEQVNERLTNNQVNEPEKTKPKSESTNASEETAIRIIKRLRGKFKRDEAVAKKPIIIVDLNGTDATDSDLKELCSLAQLKELYLAGAKVTDDGLKHLQRLKQLKELSISNTRATAKGVKNIAGLKELRVLFLSGIPLGDAGIKELAPLTNLEELFLQSTSLTDKGIQHLAAFPKLTSIILSDNKGVTDVGLKELAKFKQLTSVNLHGTGVTKAGVGRLKKSLPKCAIGYGNN